MIEVTQTRTGPVNGNCFQACVCSILELPISAVPDFNGAGDGWLKQVAEYLEPLGLMYLQVDPDDPMLEIMFARGECFHTVEGISPRGGPHACVGVNGEIRWDPHPLDGTQHGLKTVDVFGLFISRMNEAAFAGLANVGGAKYEVIGSR